MADELGNTSENRTMVALETIVNEVTFMADQVRSWPSPPDVSLAAAWAPLLSEKLERIEQSLNRHLPRVRPLPRPKPVVETHPGMPMAEVEKIHILATLRMMGGNRERTAEALRIGPRTLYRKLSNYGISEQKRYR